MFSTVTCGNCGVQGHRCDGCPDTCFACSGDHCYLDCPTPAAQVRARQNRAVWRGDGNPRQPFTSKKTRKGSIWVKQPYDPDDGDLTPDKAARLEARFRNWTSLATLYEMSDSELAEELASHSFLRKPELCEACGTEPSCGICSGYPKWLCARNCRKIRCSVFKNSFCGMTRTRLTIKEWGGLVWCWAHDMPSSICALITGVSLSTVKQFYFKIRQRVRDMERAYQSTIVFSSEGLSEGYCHLQGDATRVKKSHKRAADGKILETTHAGAIVFLQRNSLKVVVRPMDAVEVAVGTDGKPGAVPPEKDEFVFQTLAPHCGPGVLVNSDGGSGGDGMYDRCLSQSPYAKAARRISTPARPVFHCGVDHTAKQLSRFTVVDVHDKPGFENCPRSSTSGRRRLRACVTVNHAECYHRHLKKHIPAELNLASYLKDPWLWLMCAAWRLRIHDDPYRALGQLMRT